MERDETLPKVPYRFYTELSAYSVASRDDWNKEKGKIVAVSSEGTLIIVRILVKIAIK